MSAVYQIGPWEAAHVEYGNEITQDWCVMGPRPNFRLIANISQCFSGDRIPAMEEAHARLIAAAPELLEALRDMISDHADLSEGTLAFARRAIAKATGSAA